MIEPVFLLTLLLLLLFVFIRFLSFSRVDCMLVVFNWVTVLSKLMLLVVRMFMFKVVRLI